MRSTNNRILFITSQHQCYSIQIGKDSDLCTGTWRSKLYWSPFGWVGTVKQLLWLAWLNVSGIPPKKTPPCSIKPVPSDQNDTKAPSFVQALSYFFPLVTCHSTCFSHPHNKSARETELNIVQNLWEGTSANKRNVLGFSRTTLPQIRNKQGKGTYGKFHYTNWTKTFRTVFI